MNIFIEKRVYAAGFKLFFQMKLKVVKISLVSSIFYCPFSVKMNFAAFNGLLDSTFSFIHMYSKQFIQRRKMNSFHDRWERHDKISWQVEENNLYIHLLFLFLF